MRYEGILIKCNISRHVVWELSHYNFQCTHNVVYAVILACPNVLTPTVLVYMEGGLYIYK